MNNLEKVLEGDFSFSEEMEKIVNIEYNEAGFTIGDLGLTTFKIIFIIRSAGERGNNKTGVNAIFNWIKGLRGMEAERVLKICSFLLMKETASVLGNMNKLVKSGEE